MEISERFGGVNPWYGNIDLRLLQDISVLTGSKRNTLQLSLDILNLPNLLNSDWGVRKVATPAATSPLTLVGFDGDGEPVFNFAAAPQLFEAIVADGDLETFVESPALASRWQIQLGVKYIFN